MKKTPFPSKHPFMPSFDIVSEINRQELDNAVNQATKEILTRYDFRGSKSKITLEKEHIQILADDEFRMKAVQDLLQGKLIRRDISLKSVVFEKIEAGGGGVVKCQVKLVNGIEQEKAKELVKKIKETKIKVQAAIQGEQLRVTGKQRDDLQSAIAFFKSLDYSIPLQFTNFRD